MPNNEFGALSDVSRETSERLNAYVALIEKWNPAINLVSRKSLTEIWARHIVDSAQIFALSDPAGINWVDLGSGGGLPGIVVAILGKQTRPDMTVTLVEADQRKSAFLRHVSLDLDLNVTVVAERIENQAPLAGNVVSARALAPLDRLLSYVDRHLRGDGVALLSKGEAYEPEIVLARRKWSFELEIHQSVVQSSSVVLEIKRLARV